MSTPDAINVARLREANRNRKLYNEKSNKDSPEFDPADQNGSPRRRAYETLTPREKQVYDTLDGDFKLVVVSVPQTRGGVKYDYTISDTTGIDIDAKLETAVFSRKGVSGDDKDDFEEGKVPDGGGRIAYGADNAREREVFNFYDALVNGTDKQAYTEEVVRRTRLEEVSSPAPNDPAVQLGGDNKLRIQRSGQLQYLSYNEQFDQTLASQSDNPDETAEETQTTTQAATGPRQINCQRVAGDGNFSGTLQNPLPKATLTSSVYRTTGKYHGAIDLSNCGKVGVNRPDLTCNNEVLAAGGGTVESVLTPGQSGGCGNTINIRHSEELRTQYCHLFEVKVQKGDPVSAGQVIGIEGNTGSSQGVHLHFATFVTENGTEKRVNPCGSKAGLDCTQYPLGAGIKLITTD